MNAFARVQALQKTAKRKPKGRLEREVQVGVMAYLATRTDVFWWRANTQAGFAPSGQFMRSGVKGQPDLFCVQAPAGRLIGIELKREKGGRVSPDQERFAANLIAHGGVYCVARGTEDVERVLGSVRAHVVRVGGKRVIRR